MFLSTQNKYELLCDVMKPTIRFNVNIILFDLSNSYVNKDNETGYKNCGVGAQYN